MLRDEIIQTATGRTLTMAEARQKGALHLAALVSAVSAAEPGEAMASIFASQMEDPDKLCQLSILYSDDRDAFDAAVTRIRGVKGTRAHLKGWLEAVQRQRRPLRLANAEDGIEGPDGLPAGLMVPEGYRMDFRGIYAIGTESDLQLTVAPIWVTGRLLNVDTGDCLIRLGWPGWGQALRQQVVGRQEVAESGALISLAAGGAPIHSANARELTRFLAATEQENQDKLPIEYVTARCGWVMGGFLLGRAWFPGPASKKAKKGEEDEAPASTKVEIHVEGGEAQLADGLGIRGTWSSWCQAMARIGHLPIPWLSVYASVGSVLLDYLGIENGAAIDFSGETSRGKTTTLRVAASVWGKPAENAFLRTWKGTPVAIEHEAAFYGHLPLILDDTKHTESDKEPGRKVRDTLYAHTSGSGKARGAKDGGMRQTLSWLSFLISSGEQPATTFTQDAGSRARCLCIRGSPFDSEQNVRLTVGELGDNYGHLGRRVIEYLLQPGVQLEIQAEFEAARQAYSARLGEEGAVGNRLSVTVAVLDIARDICTRVGCPTPSCDPLALAVESAKESSQEADRPAAALRLLYEMAVGNSTHFYGRHQVSTAKDGFEAIEPISGGGWWGKWSKDELWDSIAFMPSRVKAILEAGRFDITGTVERWDERGWLMRGEGKNRERKTRVDGKAVRCIVIPRQILVDVAGVE